MHEPKLKKYSLYLRLTVLGESPDDALDYAITAIDNCDLLDQDGVVGIEVVDDADSIEPINNEDDDDEFSDAGDAEEGY
jgi:hypothetical protein